MNTYDIKTVADAAAELTRKTSQTLTDAGTKAWKDFHAFGDTVTKVQTEMLKDFSVGNGYGDVYSTISKMQAESIKAMGTWVNMFNGTNGTSK